MSVSELVLTGPVNRMRVNELQDGHGRLAVIVENIPIGGASMLMTLDQDQQHMLMLYLKERLS